MPDYYTRQAQKALRHVLSLLGHRKTRTDVVNRAVEVYDQIETERAAGHEVGVMRDGEFVPFKRLDWE